MGALFGIVGSGPSLDIDAPARCLRHRGTETVIERPTPEIALGSIHRRGSNSGVAIRDGIAVACDAKLYNPSELRASLINLGTAATPAALLLALYREFGLEALDLIDGDFAYAVVDLNRRELVLARDLLGGRPLYWARLAGGGVAFASEYKALLALPGVRAQPDLGMIQYLQCSKLLPAGRTLLESVAEALPGTALRLDFAGAKLEHRSLPDVRTDITLTSEAEATQLVCAELAAAVRRRTADLYTLGLALSGGIDSIAIAFILRRLYPEREIHTFTTGCGPEDPEMATAARVAARIGARHHEVLTPPELLDGALIKLVWHLEDPVARTEALQLLQLGQAARPYVDVLVSGQGADSLFAGMPKYILFELTRYLPLLRGGLEELYYLSQLSLPPRTLAGRMLEWLYRRGRVPAVPLVPGASMPSRPELPPPGPERINRIIAAGLPGSVAAGLRKFERAFAAAGLEHRAPFCDPRLARLAFRVSDRLKVRGWGNKHILRRALATLVDREFLAVPKRTQKMYCDFDFAMALDAAARDVLSLDQVASRGLFDPDTIAALFHRPPGRAYAPEAAMRIWTVLLTEHWARLFVDGRGMLPENLRQAA